MTATAQTTAVLEEDKLRADLYDFLAALLSGPPSQKRLQQAAGLSGDESPLGQAINAMARVAGVSKEAAVSSEFTALFIGLGRGELLPYASFYLTGFLNEKPLAGLRKDMNTLMIARAPNVFEPEDNIASLLEMMAGLIMGRFGEPVAADRQVSFFNKHIAPWAEHFFADLEAAKNSVFYASVGSTGKAFIEIEREAFRMNAGKTA